jgi:hypothetical protein
MTISLMGDFISSFAHWLCRNILLISMCLWIFWNHFYFWFHSIGTRKDTWYNFNLLKLRLILRFRHVIYSGECPVCFEKNVHSAASARNVLYISVWPIWSKCSLNPIFPHWFFFLMTHPLSKVEYWSPLLSLYYILSLPFI